MDINQKALVSLLSCAIRDLNPGKFEVGSWETVYSDALAHHVHTLLYPVITKLDPRQRPDEKLMSKWHISAVKDGFLQFGHMQEAGRILNLFDRAGIPVVALKGLVLREFYPQPELRIMTDSDILVHSEHLEKAKLLLKELGYTESGGDPKHIDFSHKSNMCIEVHKSLLNSEHFSNSDRLDEEIWKHAVEVKISGIPALSLSIEDNIIYLSMHMADHMLCSGFGLRQLCDLVLLIEAGRDEIDWTRLWERIGQYGMGHFFTAIMLICRNLLDLKIPQTFDCSELEADDLICLFINDIFSGGIYGKSDSSRVIGTWSINHSRHRKSGYFISKLRFLAYLLFTPLEKLGAQYSYAKKHHILVPVMLVHRLIRGLRRRDVKALMKTAITSSSKEVFDSRVKLLDWLEI